MQEEFPTKAQRKAFYGREARQKLLEGVDAVANAVKATMGAKGRNAVTSYGHTTKDGVTVARDVNVDHDPGAAHGAKLVKSACVKTCDVAGDGTTLTAVLTQAIVREGMRMVDDGKDAQSLRRELEDASKVVVDALKAQAVPVTDVRQIAEVSANDKEVGRIVSEAVNAVGAEGLVTVENTYGDASVEIADGLQIDKGLVPGPFLTEENRRRASYDNAAVLIFNGKIHDLNGFAKAIEPVLKEGKPLLIIADDYDAPVLRTLQLTAMQAGARFVPIRSPMVYHDETLEDLAVYTGATVVSEADGFKNFKRESFGSVLSVVATPEKTTIRCDASRKDKIEERVAAIYEDAKRFTESERRNVEKRASRLKGKIAIVRLPSTTEEEGRERKDRVEDAIYASQAALETGVVPGGGFALLTACGALGGDGSWSDGARVLVRALEQPMRQIARNAGLNDAEIVREARSRGMGYNVLTDAYEDLMATGIVDPAKVPVTALGNAVSVACLALTTEVLVADYKVKA